jgi:hypothetical protein
MPRSHLFVIACGVALAAFVLEMVRRRRLREEYSWLWILAAIGYLLVALFPNLAIWVSQLMGSGNPVSAFTFIGLFFLFLICVQFSVQISRLAEQNKDLTQQIAILDCEVKGLSTANASEDSAKQEGVKREDAQRPDHRSGRLVPGTDQHQPAGGSLAEV